MPLLALFALHAAAQGVNVVIEPKELGALLTDISNQTTFQSEAGGVIAKQVVALIANGRPDSEVRDKVAYVSTGKWSQNGTKWTLSLDDALAKKQAQQEFDEKVQQIKEQIQNEPAENYKPIENATDAERLIRKAISVADRLEQNQNDSQLNDDIRATMSLTPVQNFATNISQLVPVTELAKIGAGGKLVFSSQPNSTQLPLEPKAQQIIQTAIKSYQFIAEASKRFTEDQLNKTSSLASTAFTHAPKKLLIIASDQQGMLDVNCELVDDQGVVVAQGSTQFDISPQAIPVPESMGKAKPVKITFSEGAKLQKTLAENSSMKALDNALMVAKQIATSKQDPLAMTLGDVLTAYAKVKGKALVACLPDDLYGETFDADTTTAAIEDKLFSANISVVEDANWITMRPGRADYARRMRTDRKVIRDLFSDIQNGVAVPIALGNYARKVPDPLYQSIGLDMLQRTIGQSYTWFNPNLLRFFASLPTNVLDQLEANKTVPLNLIPAESKEHLKRYILGESPMAVLDTYGQLCDSSEFIGGSIPGDLKLQCEVDSTDLLAGKKNPSLAVTPEEIGSAQYYTGKSDSFDLLNTKDEFGATTGKGYYFNLTSGQVQWIFNMMTWTAPRSFVALEALPKAIQDKIADGKKSAMESAGLDGGGLQRNDGGGTKPPR